MANSLAWLKASALPNLMFQDFESGVLPVGWTTVSGSPNYGYTPAIEGSFSLNLNSSADQTRAGFVQKSNVFLYFRLRLSSTPGGAANILTLFTNGTTGPQLYIYYSAGGNLQVFDSSQKPPATTVATFSINTNYHVWVHYTAGTGSNAVCSVAFSTDDLEPTSGDNFALDLLSDSTGNVGSVLFLGTAPTTIDQVGMATFDMPVGW